jgi:hypothetical protein
MRRGLSGAAAAFLLLGCRTVEPVSPPVTPPPPAAAEAPASQAPAAAQAPAAEPKAEHYENTVRWSTASEVDNFGYDVYRATSADGPFERLTRDPVSGAGTTDLPQRYSFVDDSIDPHQAYYYYVESISLSGERERFTPVIRAKPKLPPGGPASQPSPEVSPPPPPQQPSRQLAAFLVKEDPRYRAMLTRSGFRV